ncbi:pyrroloquinoline quinone biosynthesis peptide chaperone PqqD [Mesorhizobium sp. M0006]|uniref:pyrroloquinoline quinone biosynthesis peptide chaperone PqqD n=1 Tax=Mesorhizobium sp. M0006 TaxID=2956838 RepID=UPI0033361389
MSEARQRIVMDDGSRLRLPRHVRLQFDQLRGRFAVLSPEKVFWPDDTALEILQLVDGTRTVADIVDTLCTTYDAPREAIASDTIEFLQDWCDQLLIRA